MLRLTGNGYFLFLTSARWRLRRDNASSYNNGHVSTAGSGLHMGLRVITGRNILYIQLEMLMMGFVQRGDAGSSTTVTGC